MPSFSSYKYFVDFQTISSSDAKANVDKGILFEVEQYQCPPNTICPQVVKYVFKGTNDFVDGQIYQVLPSCPPNARCKPTLYAAKGKVQPIFMTDQISSPSTMPMASFNFNEFYKKNKTIVLLGGGILIGLLINKLGK
jgi:hypothetical protein